MNLEPARAEPRTLRLDGQLYSFVELPKRSPRPAQRSAKLRLKEICEGLRALLQQAKTT